MNDLISIQAAIEALKGLPKWWADEGGYYGGAQPPMAALLDPEDAVSAIENLPSAQPERRWIPIKNRLPAVRWRRCLITRDDGRGRATVEEALFSSGRWYSNEWLEDGRNRKYDTSESVIAWAPFPAPYRGGETE